MVGLSDVESRSDRIAVTVNCDGPCLLVVARPWAPGWQARVGGEVTPVVRTNLAGLGLHLNEGEHHAELRYRPWF